MKKSERLNDMILFLNNKTYFNLRDLMKKYSISKSTALRDIESLENIGMPIFSEIGRNGRYGILKNSLLSAIIFNLEEIFTLYFLMLSLDSYQTTPFHTNLEKLKQKFNLCLSHTQRKKINKIEKILSMNSIEHNNSSIFLKEILENSIEENICEIIYETRNKKEKFRVQFFEIFSSYGQWYTSGFILKKEKIRVFRCDKILKILKTNKKSSKKLEELINISNKFKGKNAIEFKVEIKSGSVDLFYKETYPTIKLLRKDNKYIIEGFYNPNEESFIAEYFLRYGNSIISIEPIELKELIQCKLKNMTEYYSKL